jgi:hypothetical protein
MANITLDIYKEKGEILEILTFDTHTPIRKPMFSLLNAFEAARDKFLPEPTYSLNDTAYVDCQRAVFVELLGDDIAAYLLDDYIEKEPPFNFLDVKKFLHREIKAIEEFTRYLEPKAYAYAFIDETGKMTETMFNGKAPSEKYSEAMRLFRSSDFSPDSFDEMVNILGNFLSTEDILDDIVFIPAIKAKRYSQISDDIREVDIKPNTEEREGRDAYKHKGADRVVRVYKTINRTISRCYYTSNGVFPLIWAEIKYAIENDIFARQCNCGKYFVLKPMQRKTCSDKCRDEQRKKNEMRNPNYAEIIKLKQRKSRLKKKLIECKDKAEIEKFQNMIDKVQKEINALKQY